MPDKDLTRAMSSERLTDHLSDRRAGILQLVIQDYIETAIPVASRHVVEKYALPASPATIRHEMHALEQEGYLTHPHTSAGRVPSNRGYRHFVQSLMGHAELGMAEQASVRHQFFQAAPAVDEWVELAATVLARSLGLLVIVAPPHPERLRVRQLELISLNELLVLMIVVVQEARMIRQLMPLPQPIEVDELDDLATRLSSMLRGRSAPDVREAARQAIDAPDTHPVEHFVLDTLAQVLDRDALRAGVPSIAGLAGMMAQPEFQHEPQRSLELIELVDQHAAEDLIRPRSSRTSPPGRPAWGDAHPDRRRPSHRAATGMLIGPRTLRLVHDCQPRPGDPRLCRDHRADAHELPAQHRRRALLFPAPAGDDRRRLWNQPMIQTASQLIR